MAFIQISSSTNYYKYSFFPALVKIWNSLPADFVSAKDLDTFKEGLSPSASDQSTPKYISTNMFLTLTHYFISLLVFSPLSLI